MTPTRLFRIALPFAALTVTAIWLSGCATKDWRAFRYDVRRTAHQPNATALSDPAMVSTLHVSWSFQPPGAKAFRGSPIMHKGRVYIGNGNGYFYALDATTGALLWQYPPLASPPLTSTYTCNPSSLGIASSAAIARIGGTDAVIFGAPGSVGTRIRPRRGTALRPERGDRSGDLEIAGDRPSHLWRYA